MQKIRDEGKNTFLQCSLHFAFNVLYIWFTLGKVQGKPWSINSFFFVQYCLICYNSSGDGGRALILIVRWYDIVECIYQIYCTWNLVGHHQNAWSKCSLIANSRRNFRRRLRIFFYWWCRCRCRCTGTSSANKCTSFWIDMNMSMRNCTTILPLLHW